MASSAFHVGDLVDEQQCVASYKTAQGALLAVDHLTECGVAREALGVIPGDLRVLGGEHERDTIAVPLVRPIVVGVVASVAAAMLVSMGSTSLGIAGAVALGIVGAATVAAARRVERWRIEAARWRTSRSNSVNAGRFDVVSQDASRRAAHLLARWWNPQAQPVSTPELWSADAGRSGVTEAPVADGPPAGRDDVARARTSDGRHRPMAHRPDRSRPGDVGRVRIKSDGKHGVAPKSTLARDL